MNEIWKDIACIDEYSDLSGKIFVSNFGRIKKLKKGVYTIIEPTENLGYHYISVRTGKSVTVHSLVAKLFVNNPCPDKYKEINHIDKNRGNNHFSNLEWCDHKTNCSNIYNEQRIVRGVIQYDKQGNLINVFSSIHEAAKALNIIEKHGDVGICFCLNGKRKTAYGYKWQYAEK